jgi:hypothetical protein
MTTLNVDQDLGLVVYKTVPSLEVDQDLLIVVAQLKQVIIQKQPFLFVFQTASGQPLAFGTVTIQLNTDAVVTSTNGPQVVSGRTVKVNLDGTGSATPYLWPNSVMSPSGTVYNVTAYSAQGQLAWSGQISL